MSALRIALCTLLASLTIGCQFSAVSVGEVRSIEGRQSDVPENARDAWNPFTSHLVARLGAPVSELPLRELLYVAGITPTPHACLSVPDARVFFVMEKAISPWPALTMVPSVFALSAIPFWGRYDYRLSALLVSEARRDLAAREPEALMVFEPERRSVAELPLPENSAVIAAASRKGHINTYTSFVLPIGVFYGSRHRHPEDRGEPELLRLLLLATLGDLASRSCGAGLEGP